MSSTQVSLLSTLLNKELIATVNSRASTAGPKPQIFMEICTLTQIGKVQTGTRLVSDNFQAREGSRTEVQTAGIQSEQATSCYKSTELKLWERRHIRQGAQINSFNKVGVLEERPQRKGRAHLAGLWSLTREC